MLPELAFTSMQRSHEEPLQSTTQRRARNKSHGLRDEEPAGLAVRVALDILAVLAIILFLRAYVAPIFIPSQTAASPLSCPFVILLLGGRGPVVPAIPARVPAWWREGLPGRWLELRVHCGPRPSEV